MTTSSALDPATAAIAVPGRGVPGMIGRVLGRRVVRFAMVGTVNTAIDFGLFVALATAGIPVFGANAVSTSAGLLFSYFANRRFTFGVGGRHDPKAVLLFVAVTGTGLWLVQPLVILGVAALLPASLPALLVTGAGKAAAIAVGLVWNFALYRTVVFRAR